MLTKEIYCKITDETKLVIHSDEWPTYSNLNSLNYHHLEVDYQRRLYVDKKTGEVEKKTS